MASEDKIKEGARPFLEAGEEVLAAFVARPRGWTQAMAGSMHVGAHQQGKQRTGAEQAGFELASPMALAITGRRLLSFSMGAQAGMGVGGGVKELVGEAPLAEVEEVKVKRLLMGKVVELKVRGRRSSSKPAPARTPRASPKRSLRHVRGSDASAREAALSANLSVRGVRVKKRRISACASRGACDILRL